MFQDEKAPRTTNPNPGVSSSKSPIVLQPHLHELSTESITRTVVPLTSFGGFCCHVHFSWTPWTSSSSARLPFPTVPWEFAFSARKTSSVLHSPALVSGYLLILKSAKGHGLSSREERKRSECSQVWDWISNTGQSSQQHRNEHMPTGHCSGCLDISISRTAYRFFLASLFKRILIFFS